MNTETEIEQTRTRAAIAWSRDVQVKDNIDIHTLNETLLAFQFNQLLEAINFKGIKEKVEQSPKDFLDVARTMTEQSSECTKRTKVELESQMYRDQVAEQKRKLQETIAGAKTEHGLTPETLRQIEEVMATL